MLEIKGLSYSYKVGSRQIDVLKNLDFSVKAGEFIGIQGPSGSGKSTLFYILGLLLKPNSGEIVFDSLDITKTTENNLTFIRNRKIGFIFQQFHLLSKASVLENILLPTHYPIETATQSSKNQQKAKELSSLLGLKDHLSHFPNQLSGGQQQRVAIARALMNDVQLILADEPTGNLDSKNAQQILELLNELNRQGKTIILITHDPDVARHCSKVYHLKDGAFTNVEENFPTAPAPQKISSDPISKFEFPAQLSLKNYYKLVQATFPLVTENLLRNKAKSLLTMLGVVIGVAAVLAMVTLGQFTKTKILESYEALGVNKLLIHGYPNWNLKATDTIGVNFRSFDLDKDLLPLKKIFPEIKFISPVMENGNNSATAGGLNLSDHVTSLGVSTEFLRISNRMIKAGRGFSPYHIENRSPVCLIGYEIAERLFLRTPPIGQILTVSDGQRSSFPCQVIGVLENVTKNEGWSPPNRHVILPYTYFETVNSNWWSSQIHEAALQIAPGTDVEAVGLKVKSYFVQKYGKSGQFVVDSDSTLIGQMKRFLNLFSILLTTIALLSLAVGGIGINNMMLVSVTERIKEFGIRKALGATNSSIRIQVLMESMGLCLIAGLIGVFLGFAVYEILIFGASKFIPHLQFEWFYEPLAALLSLSSILAVGISSGLIPALKAEKLQIIEALRAE